MFEVCFRNFVALFPKNDPWNADKIGEFEWLVVENLTFIYSILFILS